MENNNDDETLNLTVDELFKDTNEDSEQSTKNEPKTDEVNKTTETSEVMTKAVSERINSVKRKTEDETQEKIAKELGYQNYADLQKANEKQLMESAGLNEADVESVVEKLVEKRLANDPRMKKLEDYENREKTNFVETQLKEINTMTGNNYTSIEQLPTDTLEVWKKTGNLKQAYLATQGEALISKTKIAEKNGSTTHLADSVNTGGSSGSKRLLNESEKAIWRSVIPDITEEELSKKTIDIE